MKKLDKRKYAPSASRDILVIPPNCSERFVSFKNKEDRMWPDREIDVAGISDIDKGYSVHRVYSAFHVLMYIVSGSLHCDIGLGYRRRSRQAVILFLTAGGIHKYHAEITHPYNVVPSSA